MFDRNYICKFCGGDRSKFVHGVGVFCAYCGRKLGKGELSEFEEKIQLADEKRNEYQFEYAAELYREVLQMEPDNQRANFGALLAEYKIIYLLNDKREYTATFFDPNLEKPLTESEYYYKLQDEFRSDVQKIEERRRIIVRESAEAPKYDVFLSYRQHTGVFGETETIEAQWAIEVYRLLKRNDLKVFFDRESLKGHNAGWEPHIYAALRSAKFMAVLGSSKENFEAPWVKNEWMRYLKYGESDSGKKLAVVTSIEAKNLPQKLHDGSQKITYGAPGWKKDLLERAKDANRKVWRRRQIPKYAAAAGIVALVIAFGTYAYVGVTNPISYTVDGQEASVSGANLFFSFAVKDLQLDTYGKYPVVKIEEGAFKNTAVETVRLGESVKEVGAYAFQNCTSLTSVTLEECVYVGRGAFEGCENLREITLALHDDSVIEAGAFAGVEGAVVSVPSVAEEASLRLQTEYPSLQIRYYTREKAEECRYFIEKLQTVRADSGEAIERAERAYAALNDEERAKITNYGTLQNARAAFNAAQTVQEIGTVSLESGEKLAAAERAYAALTTEQKALVYNRETLANARAVYDAVQLIHEIGEVEISSEGKIARAEEAYLALTPEQKDVVFNYEALTKAREEVDALRAAAVTEYISAIGKVTLASRYAIELAEGEYALLTDGQKARVKNHDVLQTARASFDCIAAIDEIGVITVRSEGAIRRARTLFDGLTALSKAAIYNYTELTDAEAVFPVVAEINELGNASADFGELLDAAEKSYGKLKNEQKEKVSNYQLLVNARAAQDTVEKIEAIGRVDEGSKGRMEAARAAYNALTSEQQSAVSNYQKLVDSEKAYPVFLQIAAIGQLISADDATEISAAEAAFRALTSSQKSLVSNEKQLNEAVSVLAVAEAIAGIGEITEHSGTKITTAKNLYDGLTEEERARVADAGTLTDAVAVFAVVEKIALLGGAVAADSLPAIEEAERANAALTAMQQLKVSNIALLTGARAVYRAVELIEAIGAIDEGAAERIEAAQTAYHSLESAQRNRVGNKRKLDDALAVYAVFEKINALGRITNSGGNGDSLEGIRAAEQAYGALTASQKTQLSNARDLTRARGIYNMLHMMGWYSMALKDFGKGTQYSYLKLTKENAEEELNNRERCEEIDSCTYFSDDDLTELSETEYGSLIFFPPSPDPEELSVTAPMLKAVFPNLNLIRMDLSAAKRDFHGGSLTVESSAEIGVAIIGAKESTFYDFRIVVNSRSSDFYLELCDMNLVAPEGKVAIDAAAVSSAYTVEIAFRGTCSVRGGKGADGQDGKGYDYNHGYKSQYDGVSGTDGASGAVAVSANKLTLTAYSASSVTINGGAGGKGGNGGDGGGSAQKGIAQSGHGAKGGAGGSGANAISASVFSFENGGDVTLCGGTGGDGGYGGRGGNNKDTDGTDRADHGGDGGDGGRGGRGGLGLYVQNGAAQSSGVIAVSGGAGGKGGNGGRGGNTTKNTFQSSKGGDGGDGGDGGNGGDGGTATNVAVSESIRQTAGAGGNGGIGGAEGVNNKYSSENGDPGDDGDKGKDGAIDSYYLLTVRYRYEDGSVAREDYTESFKAQQSYRVSSRQITGYTPDLSAVTGEMTAQNRTVTVVYSANAYTIAFSLNDQIEGGEKLKAFSPAMAEKSKEVFYASSVMLPVPKDGKYYTFLGWFSEKDGGVMAADGAGKPVGGIEGYTDEEGNWRINENATLYAHWGKVAAYRDYRYVGALSDLTAMKSYPAAKYLLVCDVDLQSATWSPVECFTGILEGDGHTISNAKVSVSSGTHAGFILENRGTVRNVTVKGLQVSYSVQSKATAFVGVLTGYQSGTVENCSVLQSTVTAYLSGNVGTYERLFLHVGGVSGFNVGSIKGTSVKNCTVSSHSHIGESDGEVEANSGAVVGINSGTLMNCSSTDNMMKAHVEGGKTWTFTRYRTYARSAGIAGYNNKLIQTCTVSRNTLEVSYHTVQGGHPEDHNAKGDIVALNEGTVK